MALSCTPGRCARSRSNGSVRGSRHAHRGNRRSILRVETANRRRCGTASHAGFDAETARRSLPATRRLRYGASGTATGALQPRGHRRPGLAPRIECVPGGARRRLGSPRARRRRLRRAPRAHSCGSAPPETVSSSVPCTKQRRHARRTAHHGVAGRVALGQNLGGPSHQRRDGPTAPETVSAGEITHAGLRDDPRQAHSRLAVELAGGARRATPLLATSGPQREVPTGRMPEDAAPCRDRAGASTSARWSIAAATSTNVIGQPPPPPSRSAHSMFRHRPAAPGQVPGETAHHDLAVARAPGAPVDDDHHGVWPAAARKVQIGALRAVAAVAVRAPWLEQVADQAGNGRSERES